MEYVALVLAIVAGAAATTAAVFWSADQVKAKEIAILKEAVLNWDKGYKAAKAEFDAGIQRRELLITELKAEITNLENDLAANRDPAAVRARLGKLLSPP